ncbi:hypothetical protein HED50_23700 [Ochrobactrum oryzae]|nr:hypothetical protein [Brucella oryzae]
MPAKRIDLSHFLARANSWKRPVPVFPAGLLRSEPAADPFKAALRRDAAGARRSRQGWPAFRAGLLAPLVRKPTLLAWQAPDPEASSFRRFSLTAPAEDRHGAGSPEGHR